MRTFKEALVAVVNEALEWDLAEFLKDTNEVLATEGLCATEVETRLRVAVENSELVTGYASALDIVYDVDCTDELVTAIVAEWVKGGQ